MGRGMGGHKGRNVRRKIKIKEDLRDSIGINAMEASKNKYMKVI